MHDFDSKYVFSTSSVKYIVENERSRSNPWSTLESCFYDCQESCRQFGQQKKDSGNMVFL